MEFYNPVTHANAGQQFIGMERLREVVIAPTANPFTNLFFSVIPVRMMS